MRRGVRSDNRRGNTVIVALVMLALILTTLMFVNVKCVNASSKYQLSYQSIEVESGDTLWSIAEEYRGELSTKECMDLISGTNGIQDTDQIQSGDYLLVPDFVQEH